MNDKQVFCPRCPDAVNDQVEVRVPVYVILLSAVSVPPISLLSGLISQCLLSLILYQCLADTANANTVKKNESGRNISRFPKMSIIARKR